MKTTSQIIIFYIFSLAIVLLSCSSAKSEISDTLDAKFTELVKNEELNKYFEVRLVSDQEVYEIGTVIRIFLYNVSDEKILFPVGYGIRLFIVIDNEWIEIDNKSNFSGEAVTLPSISNQELGARLSFGVLPALSSGIEIHEKIVLRILIQGTLMSSLDTENTSTGAFVDVFIEP
ncbi:MAG: hypothetical protein J0M11_07205 [Anaerolineae bacterium]|nr:hypothetical protein [Anaerolineae bacterium]